MQRTKHQMLLDLSLSKCHSFKNLKKMLKKQRRSEKSQTKTNNLKNKIYSKDSWMNKHYTKKLRTNLLDKKPRTMLSPKTFKQCNNWQSMKKKTPKSTCMKKSQPKWWSSNCMRMRLKSWNKSETSLTKYKSLRL
jgi:hypothetical protein